MKLILLLMKLIESFPLECALFSFRILVLSDVQNDDALSFLQLKGMKKNQL